MAFDPETGLVYIPVIESNFIYAQQPTLSYVSGAWNASRVPKRRWILARARG